MTPDVEDIGDQLIYVIKTNIADKLAAVEARKATQYNPLPVAEYYFGEVDGLPEMPSCIVAADKTATELDDTYRRMRYAFVTEINYEAEDVEVCRRIMSRYGAALDDTLRSASGPDSRFWITIENIALEFSDTWSHPQGALYQTVRASYEVIVRTD